MDVPLPQSPAGTRVDKVGVRLTNEISHTSNYEKLRFTAVLTAGIRRTRDGYDGFNLPIMFIFKNLRKAPKGGYPIGTVIEGSKGGSFYD